MVTGLTIFAIMLLVGENTIFLILGFFGIIALNAHSFVVISPYKRMYFSGTMVVLTLHYHAAMLRLFRNWNTNKHTVKFERNIKLERTGFADWQQMFEDEEDRKYRDEVRQHKANSMGKTIYDFFWSCVSWILY
eukprot:GHVL01009440.1.p1 GENE.GHVL01009440.1~~GHVL01009440.1.p1  ORF type:complete len:134 (-),score=1.71 GHVL01009440.1:142-543(-)